MLRHQTIEQQTIERARDFEPFEGEAAIAMNQRECAQHCRNTRAFAAKNRSVDVKQHERVGARVGMRISAMVSRRRFHATT